VFLKGFYFFNVEHLQASRGVEKHTVKRRKSSDDRQIMHRYDSGYCFYYYCICISSLVFAFN
jgi:hypothetical protein